MKIRTQLAITYLLIALAPLLFMSWVFYTHARDALITQRLSMLESVTDLKIKAIDDYFLNFSKEITIAKDLYSTREYFPVILRLAEKRDDPKYQQARKILDEQVEELLLARTEIKSFFFVNPDGVIAYSSEASAEKQAVSAIFPAAGATAFQKGKNEVFFSDVFYDSKEKHVDFIESAPVFDLSGNFSGVMLFEISTEKLFTLVQSISGMGNTGETLVVRRIDGGEPLGNNPHLYDRNGDSLLFLNPLRFDSGAAFKRTIRMGDGVGLPAQKAVQEKEGSGISTDYRGKKVLSVWKYLPTYHWGLVTKIDMDEILALAHALAGTVAFFSVAAIMAILFLSGIFANAISSPIRTLQKATEKIKRGNLDVKINLKRSDEIGDLSRSFGEMLGAIKQTRSEIEKKVEQQTAELSQKNKNLDDQKNAILNVLQDVEKEKDKSELLANDLAKFKLAVENAAEMVVISDSEGTVLYGNKAVKTITGYAPEEATGKKAGKLWSTPMPKEYYAEMWRTIKTEKKIFHGQLQNRRKNGEMYEADILISPVLDAKDNILFFVGIERDITKEKEIDRAKSEFVSLASHQLRTPLSSINWYAEMLLDGEVGEVNDRQKNYLKEIYAGSQRMVILVNSFLNVSRIELGTFMVEPSPTDVVSVVKEVLGEMKSEIVKKQIGMKEIYGKNISQFQADKKILRMIFQNLLSNAVKYTRDSGEVELAVKMLPSGEKFDGKKLTEDSLTVTVKDSGMGIPESQQDKIFTKLFRADNAAISGVEGTGLGLYIVKSVVEKSGGQIWFASEENKGTIFYVVFPMTGMKKKEGAKKLA
ncbi:MAG: ATP-binding protein [Candidatus Paceibacterota bacterium]|jgi:PAS domain S-box-containing protein